MNKRRRLIFLSLSVCVLLIAPGLWFFSGGPSFEGRSAQEWARDMKQRKSPEADVIDAFKNMGVKAVPFLLRELGEVDSRWRRIKRAAWNRMPSGLKPKSSEAATVPFDQYQPVAVQALKAIGPDCAPLLIEALRSPRQEVRATATWALAELKLNPRLVVPNLTKTLEDGDASVRMHSANGLGEMGAASVEAVPGLMHAALNDTDLGTDGKRATVRDAAICALGKIGPPARKAVSTLKTLLQGDQPRFMVLSAIALWRIDGDAVNTLPVLVNHYPTWSDTEKPEMLKTFADMGTNAVSAAPAIREYLNQIAGKTDASADEIRTASLKALKAIDPTPAENMAK